jgi:hypothetical protein
MNPISVTVRDETTAGAVLAELEVQFDAVRVTVAELIRARVHQEVRDHNARAATGREQFVGLVAPATVERELNGGRRLRRVDAEAQTAVALRAFERGHVLLLVDDQQVEGLDHAVTLSPGSTVTFLKLVPLVGG